VRGEGKLIDQRTVEIGNEQLVARRAVIMPAMDATFMTATAVESVFEKPPYETGRQLRIQY
jgi:hypothetical protein